MKNNIKNIAILMVMLMTIFNYGCKELDLAPEDSFTDLTYWSSEEKALSVLNTAYSQLFNSNYFFFNEALSDNAFNGRGDVAGSASLGAGTYDPSLGRLNEEWNLHYQGIKTCNILLENIDRVPQMNENNRDRFKAEARFIRAFLHFQLMTWFGDIPLLASDPSLEEALTITRTPRDQVKSFIISELQSSLAFLPTNVSLSTNQRGRITQGAVIGLLARVHLYDGDWQEVVNYTNELIGSNDYGNYGLVPSYEGLFLPENQNSQEDILSLQFVPQLRTWGQFFDMAPLSAGARLNALAPTRSLVDSYVMTNGRPIDDPQSGYDENNPYANRDPRLTYTVVYHLYQWRNPDGSTRTIYIAPGSAPGDGPDVYAPGSSSTTTGYYTRKYYDPTHLPQFASGLNLMLIRYADILLMHAEAQNELGQLSESTWDLTIRALRQRAGFTDSNALIFNASLGQVAFREIIRNERRAELAMEGLRIFDIRRWRIAEEVLNGWVEGARFGPPSENNGYLRVNQRSFDPNRHYLWPIPRAERNLNSNLSQNPGWN
ncbi:RagB/SusD family nutrient uptake outer membrane protein [Belliella sp. DSM 111904]|uniref:RagB/SusD family nutrient uptake outer membrane protein n=1 Tax=Belliella filtrata TaxID=2923435 RepID=A0ABS9V053_9BACT|nr:RagB/SusD family nutrient uptake outer membrane protein [Belliella filtrata]MCH7409782.1 RagB/SusD family nutrient uptake outer membrane protein [Belliella filtrata]